MAKGGVIDKILIAGILGSKNIIASVSPDKTELQPSKPWKKGDAATRMQRQNWVAQ